MKTISALQIGEVGQSDGEDSIGEMGVFGMALIDDGQEIEVPKSISSGGRLGKDKVFEELGEGEMVPVGRWIRRG